MRKLCVGSGVGAFVLAFLALPALAAQLTYDTVYFQPPSAGATRIPRSSNAGALRPQGSFVAGAIGNNQKFNVPISAPSTMTIDGAQYGLASATVSGGKQGDAQAFAPFPPNLPVQVGTANIVVTYVYLPVGGPGVGCGTPPCSTAAVIDEASDVTGGLLDDVFVNVFSPPGASAPDPGLTHSGNYLGVVDTTNAGVGIAAADHPLDPSTNKPRDGTVFDRWVSAGGSNFGNGQKTLEVDKQTSGYFLAYYRNYCASGFHFVATATTSECVADNCAANQVWSSADNKCIAASCPKGETCGNYTCPKACAYGCIVVPPHVGFNTSNNPVFACKNSKGGIGSSIPGGS
jgi:hypothetical protein